MQTMDSSHLCAKSSLCGLLHSFPILSREILAQVLIQVVLLNKAPEGYKGIHFTLHDN